MNTTANRNKNLSIIAAVFMGFLVLFGLQGCGSSGGGSTLAPPVPEAFITRISVNSAGLGGNGPSRGPSTSLDGRYIVFESSASNLVTDDTNNRTDIFVRDTQNNTIKRVSVDSNGTEGDADSIQADISGDGKYVVFRSAATNLVSADTNGAEDIFVHDMVNNTTIRVSIASGASGAEADASSFTPTINADGKYVAYSSVATNLLGAGNDTNNFADIFVRDIANNTTIRVSVGTGANGVEADNGSSGPSISSDGLSIAFRSLASNLIGAGNDINAVADIFVRDITNNTTTRVSVADGISAAEGNGESLGPHISANGNFVTFSSNATNFVASDLNNQADIFVRDIAANTTIRVNLDSTGAESDNFSDFPSISTDGRFVTFLSGASNLVASDTNTFDDIFVHDTQTGETIRLSVNASGAEGDGASFSDPVISADGRYVVFESAASNLVANDTEMQSDIFRVLISKAP